MGVTRGVVIAGAAVTGIVLAERFRHRGSGADVRADVAKAGRAVADRAGGVAGFVGHAGGSVLGTAGRVADSVGTTAARAVTGVGRAVADGAGSAIGAYAGVLDKVLPGRHEPVADNVTPSASAAELSPEPAAKRRSPRSHAPTPTIHAD